MTVAEKARRPRTLVGYAGKSEAGRVRSINQDSFFVGEAGSGYLAVVADGMGGHSTGEVASQKAVEIIRREVEASRSYPPAALARAVQSANMEIFDYASDHPEHHGMGTTLTTVFIDDQIALVGHVGDSRVYLIRHEGIRQLTFDHSWVAERVRQGILSQDEAKHHRLRNVITNALGALPKVKLDLSYIEVQPLDRILLCSDGVSMILGEDELLGRLLEGNPEEIAEGLIREANARGSPDNITAVVLLVEAVEARVKRYALPPRLQEEPQSVTISGSINGIRRVEETFPRQDLWSKVKRQPWYPYRLWLLGSFYLLILIVVFSFWQP